MYAIFEDGSRQYRVEAGSTVVIDFRAAEPHNLAVQIDVLPAGELGIETSAELQQGRNPSARHYASGSGLQDAADDLQQRAFAAPVGPDQAQDFAFFQIEADIFESPEIPVMFSSAGQEFEQAVRRPPIEAVELRDVLDEDQVSS